MFVSDLNKDEIRSRFPVKSDIKKVWNCWLEIWNEVDKICRKHEINYWAESVTLLGAARHGGFVPWNDEMIFCMMRPDFNRFCEVAEEELNGTIFEVGQRKFSYCQVYNASTTFIPSKNVIESNDPKGLHIVIFALDVSPDETNESLFARAALEELLNAVYDFQNLVKYVQGGGFLINEWSVMEKLHNSDDTIGQIIFLSDCAEKFFDCSPAMEAFSRRINEKIVPPYRKEWFRETIYLPFETVELPVPVDYDKVLTACYDDWRTPTRKEIAVIKGIYSAEIPYREAMASLNAELFFGTADDAKEKD